MNPRFSTRSNTPGSRKLLQILTLAGILAAWIATPARASDWGKATFDRVEGSNLLFKAEGSEKPLSLKTSIQDPSYVGMLKPASGGQPWFLFRGKLGSQELAIHALRPSDSKPVTFVYPGRVLEPKSGAVSLDSRAFYGKCVAGREDVYVVFQKERIEKKRKRGGKQVKIETSVYVAEAADNYLNEKLIERGQPRLDHTLKRVRAKECFEIEGRNRMMASRTPIRGPWNEAADNADDDEDDDKPAAEGATAAKEAAPATSQ